MRNLLNREKSPYLLQHADNPVDWYPWSDDAFEKARKEDKPIFLSIGYSTCHWCHVMAHESFEDEQVSRLMNDTFISIKVDREERPDIDSVYMTVCQLMTGSGGWPLTVLMTHDKKPFLATTYIPKETRFGRVGMLDLIPKIRSAWNDRRNELLESAEKIVSAIQQYSTRTTGDDLSIHLLNQAYEGLASRFDAEYGGFGSAPKFPTPHNLLFLLRYWNSTGNTQAMEMVEKTLQAMRNGGIYDHVGFGFHRYSTDRQWLVPHFEKMLYDQAMLLMAFIEAFQATGKVEYEQTAREIIAYVLRDLTSEEGGFYSSEDADSEGVEGKFYVWHEDEIRQILGDNADFVIEGFDIKTEGNYLEESTQRNTGENILHLKKSVAPNSKSKWEMFRQQLFEHREKRVHPHKDDKILTDWNGLMIAALAKASQAMNEEKFAEAARRAADFVHDHLVTPEGRLLHRFRDGEAAIQAYADDYAFFVWGMLELYEATFDIKYLDSAMEMNQIMMDHFWDDSNGGFFATPDDGENLLARQKEVYDGATPSANSAAMLNLLRLGRITGNAEFESGASQIGKAFSDDVSKAPVAYTQLLCALSLVAGPSYEVVIAGDDHLDGFADMLRILRQKYIPNKVVLVNPATDGAAIHRIAQFVGDLKPVEGKATAYVCRNFTCSRPTSDPVEMMTFFDS